MAPDLHRETLALRYCSPSPDAPKPKTSRVMRKLENVQATLGCPLLIVNRPTRSQTVGTLPKLNKHNFAEVILPAPPLTRSTTVPAAAPVALLQPTLPPRSHHSVMTTPPRLFRARTAEL